jgi:hypothetical protein
MDRIPFNVKELEGMVGREFFLLIFSEDFARSSSQQIREYVGNVGPIDSRGPHNVNWWNLGYLSGAVCENGSKLSEKINEKDHFQEYIFRMNSVDLSAATPVLKGTANLYNIHSGGLGKKGYVVTLTMSEIPTYKQRSDSFCLPAVD